MDALSDFLEPYSEGIAAFTGTVTCLQFLSGIVLLSDIRKIATSDSYPPEPFIGGIVLWFINNMLKLIQRKSTGCYARSRSMLLAQNYCHLPAFRVRERFLVKLAYNLETILNLKMGLLIDDQAMIKVNMIGCAINIIYMIVFYSYASEPFKSKIWFKIAAAAIFTMVCLGYSIFEDQAQIEFRFGMLITGILVVLVGMPLLSVKEIIEKKSTEGLPFPIILSGTIVAASWAIYGISIRNEILVYQNIFLLTLSSIQLSLFAIYPNAPTNVSKATSLDSRHLTSGSPSRSLNNKKKRIKKYI